MQVIITAVGPDNIGLADPIVHYVTSEGANAEIHSQPFMLMFRSIHRRLFSGAGLFFVCVALIAPLRVWADSGPGADLDPTLDRTRALIVRYETDRRSLDHVHDIRGSKSVRERHRGFYESWLERLGEVRFEELEQEQRVDYVLFQNELRFLLRELDHEQRRAEEIAPLLPFREELLALEECRRAMKPIVPRAAADSLDEINRQIKVTREKLEKQLKDESAQKPYPVTVAFRAVGAIKELRDVLKAWHSFYAGYEPEFDWWMRSPYGVLDKSLDDYAKFLRERVAGISEKDEDPVIGDPIGREALLAALEQEMIVYTPEELISIAEKELAWCDREMRKASRDLGFGEDWKKALDHVNNLHVGPGEQPQLIRKLAAEAIQFLEERDLVGIPPLCKETWRMEMMSPERQKVTPYFTGGQTISVSYPTEGMKHEDKLMSMRGNNIHFARATVHHELIPGHHLQGFMADRYRTHRKMFRTPFFVEGWALYWEMLLWDLDFPQSAEDRVGMLFWRTHRCARIIFSLRFHLGQMSAAEAIEFLIDRVGHERNNATAEVRRSVNGSYSPVYQAAYMLGGLQIRALHQQLVKSGQWTNRKFHDALLRENAIPIEMIRAALTQQSLTPDYKAQWHFYVER